MYENQDLERRNYMRLIARFSPSLPGSALTSAPTTSSAPTTAAQNSGTPGTTSTPTIITPTPTSAPVATSTQQSSPSIAPTTSSSSSTSSSTLSSSTATSLSTSTSSTSSTLAPQTVLSTTPPAAAFTLYSTSMLTSPTHIVISTGTIASATPSSTAGSSGSVNTAAVVGGIAGCLAGVAILGFLITWCIRRKRQSDEDEWSASAFKRQSAILVDDPEPSFNPRPPTMIERHNASPALNAQHNYQNYYGGYGQQAAYRYPIPNDPQAHYVNLDRSSVTPFQAAQYADISRQLGSDLHSTMAPPQHSDSLLPSPFDDNAAEETYHTQDAVPRAQSPGYAVDPFATASTASAPEPVPASRRRDISNTQRPDTVYTVYEEGDAYGGI
ncbi:uncharacterized protein EDB93DRAFT_1251871 [Suillus bovinus]|uniref:uncharacterized protein n=1 Tax=Suillus bovinus TaxID=48563 RepID=UPI001B8783CE|nr:uncharacterized protein EDB93DRAFT_1251871 [Suillus bovinus]KAG2143820.1 hypothetical protein EDB93DRAFT_1251871 [Suillus bovinus]